ncbi:MAG: hypothetical protein ABFD44_00975 [Anaerolineaceae bacterium]
MLNLKAMIRARWLVLGLLILLPWMGVQAESGVTITQPLPGAALQGTVNIQGSTAVTDFQSAEIAFAYESDPNSGWFVIQRSDQPVENGTLAAWDTTTLTDGIYRLRVRVILTNGKELTAEAAGVRVRNYTPIETNTPASAPAVTGTPQPTATALPPTPTVLLQTLTPLPTNPAEVSPERLSHSLQLGGLGAVGLFIVMGCYFLLRAASRRAR